MDEKENDKSQEEKLGKIYVAKPDLSIPSEESDGEDESDVQNGE